MQIKPYKSVGPIELGQSKTACTNQLGVPKSIRFNREGVEELVYNELIVRLNPAMDQVTEITLLPFFDGEIAQKQITWDELFLHSVCQIDGEPLNVHGFIILRKLGIAVTGIHDGDSSQMALTVFEEGAFDELLSSGVPFTMQF